MLLLLFLLLFSSFFFATSVNSSPNSSSPLLPDDLSLPSAPLPRHRCPFRCTCAHSTVICAGLGLARVPRDIPSGTTRLDLQENHIQRLRKDDFLGLRELRILHLGDNAIEEIEKGSLDPLHSLERLRIGRNRIRSLPEGIFERNKKLRRLDLSDNSLWSLSAEQLVGPAQLQSLQLDRNQLQCVDPLALSQWPSLEALSLTSNALSTLSPLDLSALPNLRSLRLSDNPWHCDCRLRWLKRLTISSEIRCHRPSHLYGRSLRQISGQHLKCSGLEKRSSGRASGGRRCRDAEWCPAGCTCTEEGTEAVVVDCHDRMLRAVPLRIPPNTVELRLEQNRLTHLGSGAFAHVPNLIRLDLSKNAIERLEPDTFAGLGRLSSLMLFTNNLTDLPEGLFAPMGPSLQVLLLNGNRIHCLRNGVFRGLSQLKLLSLYDNQIRSIPELAFAPFARSLQTVHLARNPLICDCNMAWIGWLFVDRPIETSGARCHSPKRLAHRRIGTLAPERFRCLGAERMVTEGAGQCEVDNECPEQCQCKHTTVDCSGSSVRLSPSAPSAPPQIIPRFATSLLLRSNRLSPAQLAPMSGTFPNLVHLDLSNNQLDSLPSADFFAAFPNLRELDLSSNLLRRFDVHSLGPSALSLTNLNIDNNLLRCVPLRKFRSLRSLSLRQNPPLLSLEGDTVLDQLELLELGGGSTRFVCDCQIVPILRTLRRMGRNWTEEKGDEGEVLKCGEPKHLRGKALAELGEAELNCPAANAGGGGGHCSDEGEFCPFGCACRPMPAVSNNSPAMSLRCSGSGLGQVPAGLPENTAELYLDNNQIEHLSPDQLPPLPHLVKIDLSQNGLRSLSPGTFSSLPSLSTLILSFNRLQCLPPGVFSGIGQLRVLSLHSNNLSHLAESVFAPILANLSHVALGANPFWCDCSMHWVPAWLRSKFVESGIAKCEGPPERSQQLLMSVDLPFPECLPNSEISVPNSPPSVLAKCQPSPAEEICSENHCENGGICRKMKDREGKTIGGKCECPSGFGGERCEKGRKKPAEAEKIDERDLCEGISGGKNCSIGGGRTRGDGSDQADQEDQPRQKEKKEEKDEEKPTTKCAPFGYSNYCDQWRGSIGFHRPGDFLRLGQWRAKAADSGQWLMEVQMAMRTRQRDGVVLFAGDPSARFVLLELVRSHLSASTHFSAFSAPNSPLSSLRIPVSDGLPHSFRLLLSPNSLSVTVDDSPPSVFPFPSNLTIPPEGLPLFLAGIPHDLGRRALVRFALSDASGIRGCFSDIRLNRVLVDLSLFKKAEELECSDEEKREEEKNKVEEEGEEIGKREGKQVEEEDEAEDEEERRKKRRKRKEEEDGRSGRADGKIAEAEVGIRCRKQRSGRTPSIVKVGGLGQCRIAQSVPICAGHCGGGEEKEEEEECCVAVQKRKRRVRMECAAGGDEAEGARKRKSERWRMVEVARKCACKAPEGGGAACAGAEGRI